MLVLVGQPIGGDARMKIEQRAESGVHWPLDWQIDHFCPREVAISSDWKICSLSKNVIVIIICDNYRLSLLFILKYSSWLCYEAVYCLFIKNHLRHLVRLPFSFCFSYLNKEWKSVYLVKAKRLHQRLATVHTKQIISQCWVSLDTKRDVNSHHASSKKEIWNILTP